MSSAAVGTFLVRSWRPFGIRPGIALAVSAAAALVAEGASVVWVGVPVTPWEPVAAGLALGAFAGWVSGRKPPQGPEEPPKQRPGRPRR